MNIRFSTILAVLLALPVAALAQNAPANPPPSSSDGTTAPGGHRHNGMMAALKSLDLTSDQLSQIKAIVKDTRSKNKDVTDPATRHANTQAMRRQIEAILTPAQQAQLKTTLQQMRSGQGAGTPGTQTNPV